MAKYDGLIIPRSYNDYINKSDPLGVSQALQLTGVMDAAPTAASTKPAKSGGIFAANAVIMASSATLSGVAISAGSVVRVLFTADLTGSDATTGLTLTYNGNAYAVKVGKNGALAAFVASEISSSVFKYLQAYTTLELAFDGTQFIIIGNPVVLSSADYTIYADGYSRMFVWLRIRNVTKTITSSKKYWTISEFFPSVDNTYILITGHGRALRQSNQNYYALYTGSSITAGVDISNSNLIYLEGADAELQEDTYTVNADIFTIRRGYFSNH